ncbi:MAG: efflux transporter periplasmic adaptor subunit [Thiotrichaceae bacterium]|nr:MAG: efflux transporter periplasmic adaptor subunit [Thiotrichaceae bacterium]
MSNKIIFSLLIVLLLSGCFENDSGTIVQKQPPLVRLVTIQTDGKVLHSLSGTIRARYETPIAFQVGGRILTRDIDAGQHVASGQLLFSLDPRDLNETVNAARAQLASADAALATARSELERQKKLVAENLISQFEIERFELAERAADSQRDAAKASLKQAQIARAYAELQTKQSGILIEVSGEPGQVVSIGQTVAVLAQDGKRDVEVFLPDSSRPPHAGKAKLDDGNEVDLELREIAGAADPLSRTWRARYRITSINNNLPLGSIVQVQLSSDTDEKDLLVVPLGALDERGDGARIWRVIDGHAEPVSIQVVGLDAEQARIRAELPAETRIIALGTHLLTPGMAVRTQEQ